MRNADVEGLVEWEGDRAGGEREIQPEIACRDEHVRKALEELDDVAGALCGGGGNLLRRLRTRGLSGRA